MKNLHLSIITALLIVFVVNTGIVYAQGGSAMMRGPSSYISQISSSGNNIYIVWSNYDPKENVYHTLFRASNDGGETFGPKIKINQDNNSTGTYDTDFIQLATRDYVVYVKWWDVHFMPNGSETDHLMFKRIIDGDTTIGKTIELTGNNAIPMDIGQDSIVSVAGNNVYVSWLEFSSQLMPGQHTFFRKSSDGGFSFDGIVDLNKQINGTFGISNMMMTGYGSNVYVAGDTGSQTRELFFRASNDNGTTFGNVVDLNEIPSVSQQIAPPAPDRIGCYNYTQSTGWQSTPCMSQSDVNKLGLTGPPLDSLSSPNIDNNSWLSIVGFGSIIGVATVAISVYVMRIKVK